jgi:hypothetical protein
LATPELLAEASAADLRVGERLRDRWPVDLVAAASEQAALRLRATEKFSRGSAMLFTRPGLEQATDETVARHRAQRFDDVKGTVLDLCCGIGGDLAAIGAVVDSVVGVDRAEVHALLARHNAAVHGVRVAVAVADVTQLRVDGASAVFVDPARRSATGDTAGDRRGGSSPPLEWCFALPSKRVCVKAAPGLQRRLVPPGWETEFVAVGRDLKEAVLWSPGWATAGARATVLPAGVSMVADPTVERAPVRPPGAFLLDPSPAVTRAGAVADLAATLDAWQIDARIAFLSADTPLRSPFGRAMTIESSLPFGVKPLAAELRRLDIGSVELRRRGLAGDVTDLRRRLRGKGSRSATVMLTRVADRPWALVCSDLT